MLAGVVAVRPARQRYWYVGLCNRLKRWALGGFGVVLIDVHVFIGFFFWDGGTIMPGIEEVGLPVSQRWSAVGAPYLIRGKGYLTDDHVRYLGEVVLNLGSDSVPSAAQHDSSGW